MTGWLNKLLEKQKRTSREPPYNYGRSYLNADERKALGLDKLHVTIKPKKGKGKKRK